MRVPAVLNLSLALALLPATAMAGVVSLSNQAHKTETHKAEKYWTAERLAAARPLPMQQLDRDPGAIQEALEAEEPAGRPVFGEGRAPVAGVRPDPANRLFEPHDREIDREVAAMFSALEEENRSVAEPVSGNSGAYFTSSRLVPLSADRSYPYTTVGVLFFTIPGKGDFYCTASVIRKRIIATAGQCVHSGTQNPGFYDNFEFVPAFRDGVAPFGTWEWEFVTVATAWTGGGGKLPNAADYALIEVADRVIDGVTRKLGDVVGFLGYQTQRLRPNHAHLLAFPSNFDGGNKMHQVTAKDFKAGKSSNVEYGSDMRAGSAGGPLIQDFGDNPALARWIGAISYYTNSAPVKTQGASIPDSRFTTLINGACAHRSGNC
ncbi:MAG TPA: hypothetical protein VN493_18000 [Thermoanaerobaculia bacterium]|nr:hypothetical protein [Thermoanaerobaculia bacterium]